jgi:hypothetical protein
MTRHERRETRLLRARRGLASRVKATHRHHVSFVDDDPLPYADPEMHHHISDSRKHYQNTFSFAKQSPHDPAMKVIIKADYSELRHILIFIVGLRPQAKGPPPLPSSRFRV